MALMRFIKNPRILVFLAAILVLAGARELRLSDPPLIASLRDLTFDAYQRIKPRQPLGQPIRVIDIDEASIAEYGQWPWPRTRIAQIVDRVRCGIHLKELNRPGAVGMLPDEPSPTEQRGAGRGSAPAVVSVMNEEHAVEPHDAWADDMVLAEGLARYEAMVTEPVTRLETSWAGLRSFAPDRTLVLGLDPTAPGFVWCAGQGGYGFQTAPAAAQLLADLVGGRQPALDADVVRALTPDRLR